MKLSDLIFWRKTKKIQDDTILQANEASTTIANEPTIIIEPVKIDTEDLETKEVAVKDVDYWIGQLPQQHYGNAHFELVALAESGSEEAINTMANAMKDGASPELRKGLCQVLQYAESAKSCKAIIKCLDDTDEDVRAAACRALTQLSRENDNLVRISGAIEPLFKRLHDDNDFVVAAAGNALANLKEEKAVDILLNFLPTAQSHMVRESVCDALTGLGGAAAVGALLGALNDEAGNVRRGAIGNLGVVGDARAIEPLKGLLNHPDFEEDAERALANLFERGIQGTDGIKGHKELKEDFRQRVLAAREKDRAWVNDQQPKMEACWAAITTNFSEGSFKTQDLRNLGIEEEIINMSLQVWKDQGRIRTVGLRTFQLT